MPRRLPASSATISSTGASCRARPSSSTTPRSCGRFLASSSMGATTSSARSRPPGSSTRPGRRRRSTSCRTPGIPPSSHRSPASSSPPPTGSAAFRARARKPLFTPQFIFRKRAHVPIGRRPLVQLLTPSSRAHCSAGALRCRHGISGRRRGSRISRSGIRMPHRVRDDSFMRAGGKTGQRRLASPARWGLAPLGRTS